MLSAEDNRLLTRTGPEEPMGQYFRRFWQPVPVPGYHDILAMTRFGHAKIEGDLQPLLANLRYVKDVLAAPRRAGLEIDNAD